MISTNDEPTPIRPDSDFSAADESAMKEMPEKIEMHNDIVKDEELEIEEVGEEPCHPVDSGEDVDHEVVDDLSLIHI